MADILRLAWENTVSNVDLLSGNLKLMRGGYTPAVGSGQWVNDVIWLKAETTAANIFDAINDIEDRLSYARRWWKEPTRYESVWLEFQNDGETTAGTETCSKRALIRDGHISLDMSDKFRTPFIDAGVMVKLQLTRAAWFENQNYITYSTTTQFEPMWGGQWDLTGLSDMGNAPARIQHCTMQTDLSYMNQAWFGIRSEREGISGFEHLWELEDGTAGTDTSSGTVSGASGGSALTCTFSTTATEAERASIELTDVVLTNYDHHVGRYLVLLRCKVGSSTEVALRLRYGHRDNVVIPNERVYNVDNTDWMLIELGEVMIPPQGYKSTSSYLSYMQTFTMAIDAERISGSGNLILDTLCLVPRERLFKVSDMGTPSYSPYVVGYVREDNTQFVRVLQSLTIPRINAPFTMLDWELPTDPGVCIFQAQTATAHSLTADGDIGLAYAPKWRLYRDR